MELSVNERPGMPAQEKDRETRLILRAPKIRLRRHTTVNLS